MKHLLLSLLLFPFLALNGQTTWGETDYRGEPWVRCTSRPYPIEHGLDGRHLCLWASHGRYYDNAEGQWQWQRPSLFATTEDLFTQTIVVPYLIPMLENAGAVVFTPRERDWQRQEVIVDNDDIPTSFIYSYQEQGLRQTWTDAPRAGFAMPKGVLREGDNPFTMGTVRQCETTHSKNRLSRATYQPTFPEAGRYAVYVSYQTVGGSSANGDARGSSALESVPDAHYTVWHRGQRTDFTVNQRMGGGTWVYLGTFDFDIGSSEQNRVVLTNQSEYKGVVTTDAVRFGGGMGNIERGGQTSGLPRCLEGARYWTQWAGMPQSVYSSKNGQNDYADDINARSLMLNELCGGSVFAPDSVGRGVPIELSLAVHSDAGHTDTGLGVYGSLAICTTQKGDSLLAAGKSRQMSYDLAASLLDNVTNDLRDNYREWEARALYDRNYSETRVPIVPSAILETMSHQNFGDMLYGQDPNFRFTLARSIYKTILQYVASRHGRPCTVQPLPPDRFHIEFTGKEGEVRLSWRGITEAPATTSTSTPSSSLQIPSSPTGYVLYMALDDGGYDNGTLLRGSSCNVRLVPGVLYRFRVAAVNDGGRSFPTEELVACYDPKAKKTVLVINGFHRLSSPAVAKAGQGFDLDADIGVSDGLTAGWLGRQRVFDVKRMGIVDSIGLGFSTGDLQGRFIMGNAFNYVATHAEALRQAFTSGKGRGFNIVSASSQAVENDDLHLKDYAAIDLILGLERDDDFSLTAYKSFSPMMQLLLRNYTGHGGRLLVSGAYVGSDMAAPEEKQFLAAVLHTRCDGTNNVLMDDPHPTNATIGGLGLHFDIYRQPNERHYHAHHADVLMPEMRAGTTPDAAFPAMVYADGTSAAVAYNGPDCRTFTMGFPFECIRDAGMRAKVMFGVMKFLTD